MVLLQQVLMKSVLAGAEELTLKELIIMEIKIGSSAILDL